MNKSELIKYANSVHLAYKGENIPFNPYSNASDHPFDGYDIEVMKEFVDADLIKKHTRLFEKELKQAIDNMYLHLSLHTPVKITKGSKDKRGLEGIILYSKEPLQGSGRALFVYDVFTHKSCMVRSSATKTRLFKVGERDLLEFTYEESKRRVPFFKEGTKVHLKDNPNKKGYCTSDSCLLANLENHGFYSNHIQWDNGEHGIYTLTELEVLS